MAFALQTEHVKNLRVDRAELLRYVGYAGQEISPELEARIDTIVDHVEQASDPAFTFASFPVEEQDGALVLEGARLSLVGNDIRIHLGQARYAAVCASTLGLSNEQALVRLSHTNSLDALIFDAASSALVESVADACEARVAEFGAREGLVTNGRFSCGYGDLPLALQPDIARVLDLNKTLGISVTETNLLTPRKSTTAFIGLFDQKSATAGEDPLGSDDISHIKSNCNSCAAAASCALRKAGRTCYR